MLEIRAVCGSCRFKGDCSYDGTNAQCPQCKSIWRHHLPKNYKDHQEIQATIQREREILEIPSFHRRALNFCKAITKHALTGFKCRTKEEIKLIAKTCKTCEYFNGRICTHKDCGCPVGIEKKFLSKIAMQSEHCPIGKW